MSIFERATHPSSRELAYASYVKYCRALGQQPLEQHEYEIRTAALVYQNLGQMGQA